jgi:hypothetical protein
MIKILGALLLLVSTTAVFGQESLVPIGFEPRGTGKKNTLKSTETLDSTFVYTYDTLSLPILDEFSTSKFQNHAAGFNDPNVTEQQYFRMLDLSDIPLPATAVFTSQITKRYSTNAGVDTETNLTATQIKLGDLSNYPIQYSTVNAYPPYNIFDTLDFPNDPDTIFIDLPDYTQDSARIFSAHLSDQNAIWIDSTAYRNFTHAVNPWTLGVATFDGLDANGYPYLFGSTSTGYADFLTSKSIDLSGNIPNDSIYLSFIVQREGFGDVPEPNDSLVVEFFNSVENDWDRVWSINGGNLGDFKLGHIRISQANYLTDGFRFRFKNYGGLSGMLDEFHLDYVYLRSGSGYEDTLLKDFAFVYPVGSLIETYTQVPWDHWVNDPTHMNPNVQVTVRNGSNIFENWSNGNVDVAVSGVTEGSFTLFGQNLANGELNYAPRTTYQSYHDFSGGYSFSTTPPAEEKVFDIVATATAPFADITVNDSSYTTQIFSNEYAYDDGSAEMGYGITGTQARFAYRFDPYEADTLIGVKIHFVPTIYDLSDKLFLITVWADNNGVPGNVLYTDDFFNSRFPVYEDERGVFTDYYLPDTFVSLAQAPFYVGYRQIDADRLNVGFDRNNNNQSKGFYSLNGGVTWSGTTMAGSPMIRPVFSTANNYDLGVFENKPSVVNWTVYPNPTNGLFTIRFDQADSYQGAIVRSINGQVIGTLSKEETSFSLENYPQGMYFIEAIGVPSMAKVIRQ